MLTAAPMGHTRARSLTHSDVSVPLGEKSLSPQLSTSPIASPNPALVVSSGTSLRLSGQLHPESASTLSTSVSSTTTNSSGSTTPVPRSVASPMPLRIGGDHSEVPAHGRYTPPATLVPVPLSSSTPSTMRRRSTSNSILSILKPNSSSQQQEKDKGSQG